MFTPSSKYGVCPYDWITLEADQQPLPEFLAHVQRTRTHQDRVPGPYRYRGRTSSMRLEWEPNPAALRPRPYLRIHLNPARYGWTPEELLARLSQVVPYPLSARLVRLDTKVDLEGAHADINSRIYMPYMRAKNADFAGTSYAGKRGRNQLRVYDKGKEQGGELDQVIRVEVTQRWRKAHPKPTLGEFLAGDLVSDRNLIHRVRDVLPGVLPWELVARAERRGLSEALLELREWDRQQARRLIRRNSGRAVYELFEQQAKAWHGLASVPTSSTDGHQQ